MPLLWHAPFLKMTFSILVCAALLAQAEPEAPTAPAPAAGPAAVEQVVPKRQINQTDMTREIERIKRLPIEQQGEAMKDFTRKYAAPNEEEIKRAVEKMQAAGQAAKDANPNPKAPAPRPADVRDFQQLSELDQVKYTAREFFDELVAGNARGLVDRAAIPFQLEERRIPTYEELFSEWLKSLRAKRTDLLTLYDIEVLTPAEMEKKYGKPPARLARLEWHAPRTYIAVANLSGHASVAVIKPHSSNRAWVVVGYSD